MQLRRYISSSSSYIKNRLRVWDELAQLNARSLEKHHQIGKEIRISMQDGRVIPGIAGVTSVFDAVAQAFSAQFAQKFITVYVNGKLYDYGLPVYEDCEINLVDFDSAEGKHVFWHSSAHILGMVLEEQFASKLVYGPPVQEGGFFYDVYNHEKNVSEENIQEIHQGVQKALNEKHAFEKIIVSKDQAAKLFVDNTFKLDIINSKIPDGALTSAYRCGNLIDLCKGPHIRHTGVVKSFQINKISGAYWKGDSNLQVLNRVYAISFPSSKQMKEYNQFKEMAAKRDHRRIGEEQNLFFFDRLSPGSCFFLPHGTRIYNKLLELIRSEYRSRGYSEVITPNIYNLELWEKSGHLENYKENMFIIENDKEKLGLKPMNCPGHCLIYKHDSKSYRDLPIRLADFGVLHRNEVSGALSGLTRVRRFQQDDAHIFCTSEQIFDEVLSVLKFMEKIYGIFGFKFSLVLSTRPKKYLGDIELWNQAEKSLEHVLNAFGHPWKLNYEDGAFYGPKIDIKVSDALRRKHQCATIQLDFQLPIRFDLQYQTASTEKDSRERPVMIHRAILGSLERFIGVLTEHTGGKWPFWLSPRQVMIIPISLHFSEYANQIRNRLETLGFYSDVDLTTLTFNKKIREAQLAQYNYILVVGEEEERSSSVDVRTRDNKRHGKKSVDEMIEIFTNLCETYALDSDLSNLLETSKDESESVISIDEPDNEFL